MTLQVPVLARTVQMYLLALLPLMSAMLCSLCCQFAWLTMALQQQTEGGVCALTLHAASIRIMLRVGYRMPIHA